MTVSTPSRISYSRRSVPTAAAAVIKAPPQIMNILSLCLSPAKKNQRSIHLEQKKPLLTIFSQAQTNHDKNIERHPQNPIHLSPNTIIDNLLLQITHRRKIDTATYLEDAEAPESDCFVANEDRGQETACGYHQGINEECGRRNDPSSGW
jgi:hypothetical protein